MNVFKDTYLPRRFFAGLLLGAFAFVMGYVFPALLPVAAVLVAGWLLVVVGEGVALYRLREGVEAEREMADKFSNGEENPVTLRVRSRYKRAVAVRVVDEVPPEFQRRDIAFREELPPGEEGEFAYSLRPVRRGAYGFGKIRVFVSTGHGFVERRYSFDAEREIGVYPSFMMMRRSELLALGNAQQAQDAVRMRRLGGNSSFEQIQPYVAGDDPRTVNWKATAKMNRLMVNTYREERAQQVYCVLDMGRTMRAPFDGMTMMDHAVNAILSLANVVLRKEDRVGLITFSNESRECLRADNRQGQLRRMSEMLYRLETDFRETDFERLFTLAARQVPTRGLFVLFTNFDTENGLRRHLPALRSLAQRQLLLLVLFENAELTQAAERPVASVKDAYFETVATGFALEKRRMAQELARLGIHVIVSKPEALTVNAINGYLALKRRQEI